MSWRTAVKSFLGSGAFVSMIGGVGVTGAYVAYTDSTRYPRMAATFAKGNILPPLAENDYEIAYARRPAMESNIRKVLTPTFSNEYFIVHGPVGAGKTRLIVELTRQMIETRGAKNLGAPIYVLANQGRNFAETLANAVDFYFDEHVSFRFFLDYLMRIHSIPSKDDNNRLVRVLDAIEIASFDYLTTTGRPLVLIIDGLDEIAKRAPTAVKMVQDKAKLWADTNSVKVVFVCNTEDTELLLQGNSSNWSRAANPIAVGDLSKEETMTFLQSGSLMEKSKSNNEEETQKTRKRRENGMSAELSEKVYDLVGGRIRHLIFIKRNWLEGKKFDDIAQSLMEREREKFVSVTNHSKAWKAIGLIRNFGEGKNESEVEEVKIKEGKTKQSKSKKDAADYRIVRNSREIKQPKIDLLKVNTNKSDSSTSSANAAKSNNVHPNPTSSDIANTNANNNSEEEASNIANSNSNNSDTAIVDDEDGYLLSKLVKKTSLEVVNSLIKANLLRCERSRVGVLVKFESKLTENVVNDLEKAYQEEITGKSSEY